MLKNSTLSFKIRSTKESPITLSTDTSLIDTLKMIP